ncbi:MAG: type II toxin-antitoxin system VapC family toxin, partial [Vitreimonas sp.]
MIVADASVAIKWVLEEKGSKAARALVHADRIVAPSLIMLECANALWSKVRSQLSRSAATLGLAKIANAPMRLRTETD